MRPRGEKGSNQPVRRAGSPSGPGAADRTRRVKGESVPPPATDQQIEASKAHVASARESLRPAELALVKAETPAEVRELYNLAEAYRSYTSNREQQNMAASLKL